MPTASFRRLLGLLGAMFLLGVWNPAAVRARPEAAGDTRTVEVPTFFAGIITCAKCDLKRSIKCATVLQMRVGGVIYPFDDVNHKKHHKFICVQAVKGVVTGKLVEKDGRTIIVVERVKFD